MVGDSPGDIKSWCCVSSVSIGIGASATSMAGPWLCPFWRRLSPNSLSSVLILLSRVSTCFLEPDFRRSPLQSTAHSIFICRQGPHFLPAGVVCASHWLKVISHVLEGRGEDANYLHFAFAATLTRHGGPDFSRVSCCCRRHQCHEVEGGRGLK